MRDTFTRAQITLHWLTFLLLVLAYASIELRGFAQRGSWQGYAMIMTHFSAGAATLIFMLARLVLRTRHRAPPIVPPAPRWQTGLAHLMHTLLYALFIALPVLGMASRYVKGQTWWLAGIRMPVAAQPDTALAMMLTHWHKTLAPLGYWLIGLHVVAALFHHYLLRDNTLERMWPARQRLH